MIENIVKAALEGEMDAHLTQESRESGNRRNSKMQKQVQTPVGDITVTTPRDRDASFEPQFIKKRETMLSEGMADRIIGLYALGRGVKDIMIACIDGLKGFPDAIKSVFPDTAVQLLVIHQIRNSMKYVGSKHQKELMKDLKPVYGAVTMEAGEMALDKLEEKWGEQYPIVIKSWRDNWDRLSEFFQYSEAIRKLIYTTNTVEGYHRQIRKVTKNKGEFPNDTALTKLVYLAYRNVRKKWTMPIPNCGIISQQLAIKFGDRYSLL